MTSSSTPFASAEPPHWQPVSFTVLALVLSASASKPPTTALGSEVFLMMRTYTAPPRFGVPFWHSTLMLPRWNTLPASPVVYAPVFWSV